MFPAVAIALPARTAFKAPSLTRSFRIAAPLLDGGRSTATPTPSNSATSRQHPRPTPAQTTDPKVSASQHNTRKSPEQDQEEAEAARPGPEAAEAHYGDAAATEGAFTAQSDKGRERKEAAKQGER
ncbi:hypothetical protein JCM1841_001284 [Sporobolomyces salmonicolor]